MRLTFDIRPLVGAVGRIPRRLAERRPQLLRRWGRAIVDRAHRDFDIKSRGGIGSDGIQWAPLKPATLRRKKGVSRIGISSGLLEEPAGDLIRVNRRSVTAGFADAHAEFFDEQRPLIPEELPDDWRRYLEQLTETWGEEALRGLQ